MTPSLRTWGVIVLVHVLSWSALTLATVNTKDPAVPLETGGGCREREDLCLTPPCVGVAASLLGAMDPSQDPCEDFFKYACGGWVSRHLHRVGGNRLYYGVNINAVPDTVNGMLKALLQRQRQAPAAYASSAAYAKLYAFYDACRHHRPAPRRPAALEWLLSLDGFQVATPFDPSRWDVTRALTTLMRVNGATLFDLTLDLNVTDPSSWALVVAAPRQYGLRGALAGVPARVKKLFVPRTSRPEFGIRTPSPQREKATQPASKRPKIRPRLKEDPAVLLKNIEININIKENLINGQSDLKAKNNSKNGNSHRKISRNFEEIFGVYDSNHTAASGVYDSNHTEEFSAENENFLEYLVDFETEGTNANFSLEEISQFLAGNSNSSLPPWLLAALSAPVHRTHMYGVMADELAAKRKEKILSHFRDMLGRWDLRDVFVQGCPCAGLDASQDGALDAALACLEEEFIGPLEKAVPDKRRVLQAQQEGLMHGTHTLRLLLQTCPAVGWDRLITSLVGRPFLETDVLYVPFPEYLRLLHGLLTSASPWAQHWGLLAVYLHDVIAEVTEDAQSEDREMFCTEVTKTAMGEALAHLYLHHIGHHTLHYIREQFTEVLSLLKSSFKSSLEAAAWLPEAEKLKILEKLEKIEIFLGAADYHWDIDNACRSLANVTIKKDDFLHNAMAIYGQFRRDLYDLWSRPVDRQRLVWQMTAEPFVVNAFYVQSANLVVLPAGLFNLPYFTPHAPLALNFPVLATVAAHELFHAFDLAGLHFDSNGLKLNRSFTSMESNSSSLERHLEQVSKCFHDSMEHLQETVKLHHTNVLLEADPRTPRDENLADVFALGAARAAYRRLVGADALSKAPLPGLPLPHERLFFVAAAQPYCAVLPPLAKVLLMELDEHLPNDLRMNALMRNSRAFHAAFACPRSSRMAATRTCEIFPDV